jgi:hypothetical protein
MLPPIAQDLFPALAADERVTQVWLGGSHARGTADSFSDIDLCVNAPPDWSPSALGGLWLAGQSASLNGRPFWHGLLIDGTILDVLVGEPFVGYQPLPLPAPVVPIPGSPEPCGVATEFWINTYKHRKVIGRGLWPTAIYGLHHDRMLLLRLWVQEATGEDPGAPAFSIHGMTPLVRQYVDAERARLLGMPCRNLGELCETIEALRVAASRSMRISEEKWGIARPTRLEEWVRSSPYGEAV